MFRAVVQLKTIIIIIIINYTVYRTLCSCNISMQECIIPWNSVATSVQVVSVVLFFCCILVSELTQRRVTVHDNRDEAATVAINAQLYENMSEYVSYFIQALENSLCT